MKTMLTTTALIAMLATPGLVMADNHAPAADGAATTTMPAEGTATTTAPTDTAAPVGGTAVDTNTTTTAAAGTGYVLTPTDVSAETYIGKNLYVSEIDVDPAATYNEVDANWNDIGTINDMVIDSTTGQVRAVIVDIGGFLGLGAKSVAVPIEQLRMIRDGDSQGDYFIVFTSTKAQLESAPEFNWNDMG